MQDFVTFHVILKGKNKLLLLFWDIIFWWFQPLKNLFWKIGNSHVIDNIFPEEIIRDLLESHVF